MGSPDAQDPFAVFHRPPPNETPGERAEREAMEIAARKVSERIDDELRAEKARMKRERVVRVLLLGQSESGKSTTLKNFRLRYARAAWDAERLAWRSVIQLNVVRSLRSVLESVQAEVDGASTDDAEPLTPTASTPTFPPDSTPAEPELSSPAPPAPAPHTPGPTQSSSSRHPLSLSISTKHSGNLTEKQSQALTDTYTDLRQRLEGLEEIELALMHRLGAGSEEDYGDGDNTHALIDAEIDTSIVNRSTILNELDPDAPGPSTAISQEPRTKPEWGVQRLQDALVRSARSTPSPPPVARSRPGKSLTGSSKPDSTFVTATQPGSAVEEEDKPATWLAEHRQAAKALWADEAVRMVLKRRKVRVEDGAGFFLDDLERIARLDYIPSDADVVRARLRTLGVQEYRIHFDGQVGHGAISNDMGQDWILYDVGGSRTIRHAWVPYFENIQAIIFLAPISCFDERLSEDSKVNRLEDSFLLFREICSSKLLAKATMVLFLNKCDLLKRKLRSGMQVKNYLPSFGSRPNELATVVKYLREKFREVLKEHSPEQRWSYFYATSVIDTEATATTISAVRDSILQNYLKKADFV
ncbi:G-alpha-domain-containing protein [Pholiota conissans]|uniref:G-alpha-domain-containing protein n=1 Tax=Pholiota conissans TaxID=109636 RepID=A0A9P5YTU7_9AGAR|nr:G-alpha-domain-containing protein [Pholiota conissans]